MLQNKKNFAIIVCIIILLLLILFIILYKVKNSMPKKISKDGAISLCKYVVYNKIDQSLSSKLKEIIYEKNDNSINVILIFLTNSPNKNVNNSTYTKAYCKFNSYYVDNKNIILKKFFYKDIQNNIYLYFDTNIIIG